MYKNFNQTDTNLGASGIRGVAIYVCEGQYELQRN